MTIIYLVEYKTHPFSLQTKEVKQELLELEHIKENEKPWNLAGTKPARYINEFYSVYLAEEFITVNLRFKILEKVEVV